MTIQTLDMDYFRGIAARVKAQKEAPKIQPTPMVTAKKAESRIIAKVNPRDYIHLNLLGYTGQPICISMTELEGSNNKTYEDTHKFLLEKGLYMPTPQIFMHFFNDVISANDGKTSLYYADGFKLSNLDINKIFKNLTSNYNNKFGRKDLGAWTWLNAKFVRGTGFMNLDLETVNGLNQNGSLKKTLVPLEECLHLDTSVNLDTNSQGLAKYESLNNKHRLGVNFCFRYPREGAVGGFGSDSTNLVHMCYNWDNANAEPGQVPGSFACFEGAFK